MKIIINPKSSIPSTIFSFESDSNTILFSVLNNLDYNEFYMLDPLDIGYSIDGSICFTHCLSESKYWTIKKLVIPEYRVCDMRISIKDIIVPTPANSFEVNFDPDNRSVQIIFNNTTKSAPYYVSFAQNVICGISDEIVTEMILIGLSENIVKEIIESRIESGD